MTQKPKYSRVLLKLSGEALAGDNGYGFDHDFISSVAVELIELSEMGIQVGVVIGGGNIWRGRQGRDMNRVTADHMGMLATAINSLALKDAIERLNKRAVVLSAVDMRQVAKPYTSEQANEELEKGNIVIFACGIGNPFFSTDTTAALRAAEIGAQVILLAKNVDGVYDSDPNVNSDAKMFTSITYNDFISKELKAMDTTAIILCKENSIPICVFALAQRGSIKRVVCGEMMGTMIE